MKYSAEHLAFLKENYPLCPLPILTAKFNEEFKLDKTAGQIRSTLKNHKIHSGRTGHFGKGASSWNAGTKGLTGANSGSFKNGSIPGNRKPIGDERICTQNGYLLRKVNVPNKYTKAKTSYQPVHRINWEAEHGPIPDGFTIVFIDGNRLNPNINNLELMSRQELLQLNRISQKLDCSPEYRDTLIMLAKVETKTFELQRGDS